MAVILLLGLAHPGYGQDKTAGKPIHREARRVRAHARWFTTLPKLICPGHRRHSLFPSGSFRSNRQDFRTTVSISFRTQNKQSIAQIDYELYLAGGKILLDGVAKYSLFPDRFYGSGNRSSTASREDFNSRNWRLQMNLQRRWGANLFAGLRLEMFSRKILRTAENGLLAAGDISGSRGGTLSALGCSANGTAATTPFPPPRDAFAPCF